MLRNSCDIQYSVILVLHHNLLLVNVHFLSTRCAFFLFNLFLSEFTVIGTFIGTFTITDMASLQAQFGSTEI